MKTCSVRTVSCLALMLFVPATAHADDLAAAPDPVGIYGGDPVGACEWPSAAWLDECTASLIHPDVMVLAAHCIVLGGQPSTASFGEDFNRPARRVPIAGCVAHPDWTPSIPGEGNDDIAVCQLAERVEDVPIVPVLMGCEADALVAEGRVTLAGYGVADDNLGMGPKRWVEVPIKMVGDQVAWLGDGEVSACNGDSGGPAYVQLEDGSWRVFGVTSGQTNGAMGCPQTGVWTLIPAYMDWLESTTGRDLTPCHDADGTWNPGEDCTDFPMSPGVGAGAWEQGCAGGERSGAGASCGPAFGDDGLSESGGTESSGGVLSEGTADAGASSTSEDGDGTAATSLGEGTDAPGTDGTGAGTGGSGCGCRQQPDSQAMWGWWLAVVFVGFRRRA